MADIDHANREKLRIIGGGGKDWRAKAQTALGISERTLRNAISGEVSSRTQELIDALYEPLSRAGAADAEDLVRAGDWSIGRPLVASDDPSVIDECVVSHLVDPVMSLLVRLMRGKTDDGRAIVRTAVTPLYGVRDGVGEAIEQGRRIAIREMTSTARQEVRAVAASRRVHENRARARGWTASEAAEMSVEDLIAAADALTRPQALEIVACGQEQLHAADAIVREHESVPVASRLALLRAGQLRERARWMSHVGTEAAKAVAHIPGQDWARREGEDWTRDVQDGDQIAAAARSASPARQRQVRIAEAAMERLMTAVRERYDDDQIVMLSDRLESAEDMIYLQSILGEDAAAIEVRQQLAQIARAAARLQPPLEE